MGFLNWLRSLSEYLRLLFGQFFLLLEFLELPHALNVHYDFFFLNLAANFVLDAHSDFLGVDKVAIFICLVSAQLILDTVLLDIELLFAHVAIWFTA